MAIPAFASVDRNLLRQSIRVGISILITCAIAQHFERITYLFYPLMAVNVVVDDQDENSLRAARGRILGTITGVSITFHKSILLLEVFDFFIFGSLFVL